MASVLLEQPGSDSHVRAYPRRSLLRCGACGGVSIESEETCQRCGGEELERLSRTGEIYSYTTVQQGARSFVLALVQLAGGQRLTAQIVGFERELKVGLPVELADDKMLGAGRDGLFFSPLNIDFVAPK